MLYKCIVFAGGGGVFTMQPILLERETRLWGLSQSDDASFTGFYGWLERLRLKYGVLCAQSACYQEIYAAINQETKLFFNLNLKSSFNKW